MKWTLQLGVLLLLLKNGDAYEKRLQRRTMFRQTPFQGGISNRTQQTSNVQTEVEDSSDSLTMGRVRAPLLGGSQRNLQGNQSRKAGPNRRVLAHRRGLQPRTPTNQGSTPQDAGNKPDPGRPPSDPGRAPSGPTRTLSGSVSSLNVLASFAGKNRILVISAPHQSDGYYRLMMSLLKSDVYCEMAERHMQQIVMFHHEGEAGGRVCRVSSQGQITEEPLDPSLVPRLMNFLKLEEGKFSMVLLRKNLQVEERYPYPVRLEAMYEVMDKTPMRRIEKARQKGFVQRCKAAGVEGQVVDSQGVVATGSDGQGRRGVEGTSVERPAQKPTQMAVVVKTPTARHTTTTTTTTKPIATRRPTTTKASTPTTPQATTTTTRRTTTTTRRTTTTKPTTTKKPATTTTTAKPTTTTTTAKPTTTRKPATTTTTAKPTTTTTTTKPTTTTRRATTTTTKSTTTIVLDPQTTHWDQASLDGHKEQYQDTTDNKPGHEVVTISTQLTDDTLGEAEEEPGSDPDRVDRRPTDSDAEAESTSSRRGKVRNDNTEGRKKTNKPPRRNKSEKKRTKVAKGGNPSLPGRKSGKKGILYQEKHDGDGSSAKQPNAASPLTAFFASFERRRRLLVITTPSEDNRMYTQQRDEYLENVCEMAIRKVSIVIIFGSWTNASMKIDHYQLEQDQALSGIPKEDLTNQPLIKALRKDLGMTFNDYYMVLTDFDMKVKQEYEVPIAMKAVFDYIDTFPSRITEMEQQKKHGLTCKKEDKSRSLENFLSRFRWRRRLFVISAPDDEEWAYQQQLYSLSSQACNLGLRHMSVLKLVGKNTEYMGGVLELYPINGSATVEREDLSASLVRDIRNYFQVSPEYFSMLLVGKDGNVKSWYPSPMWSMSTIYDLVDSMQLRRQEMAIQQSLGMRCPDDDYGHGYQDPDGYHHRGYGY